MHMRYMIWQGTLELFNLAQEGVGPQVRGMWWLAPQAVAIFVKDAGVATGLARVPMDQLATFSGPSRVAHRSCVATARGIFLMSKRSARSPSEDTA